MPKFLKGNTMMLVLAGVAVAAIAGFALSGRSGGTPILSASAGSAAQDSVGRDFIELLQELRSVRIDTQIFADPSFSVLRDFSSPIISEPVGRENPFAPINETADTQ